MKSLKGLRIAFIAGTLGQGGAERQLFYMVKALTEHGACPQVLCLTRGEFWEDKIRSLKVPVVWVGQSPSRLIRLLRILQELKRQPVDIVQSQHFYTNLYAVAAARILGLREIGAIRNDGFSEVQENGRWLGRLSLQTPRIIAANSKQGIQNAVKLGVSPKRLFFLPNVVDTNYFLPKTVRNSHQVRLLSVGRLTHQKRIDRFLNVLAKVRSVAEVPISGIIVGEGPLRPALEQQARELGLLPDGVMFLGQVSDMRPIYWEADILVLTSDHEGTPNVVLEAMSSGLPAVATKVGGVPEVVQNGLTGYLTPPDDENSMVEALLRLAHQPSLRAEMGASGRAYVEQHHSLRQLPFWLKKLYEEVLA